MRKPNIQAGFTLFELLITLAIAAILAAAAIPGMTDFVANNRAAAQTNQVVGALRLARNAAVTRGAPVSICAVDPSDKNRCATGASAGSWSRGWIVFVDDHGAVGSIDAGDSVLRVFPALDGGSALTAGSAFLQYRTDGFLASGATTLFLRAPRCALTNNRSIAVTAQGRVSVNHAAC